MTHLRRCLLAILLVGATCVLTATPALAHARLKSSTPAEGASLAAAPSAISLTFAEAVTVAADPIRVTGPDGASWTVGVATVSGATVSAPVEPTGPAGAYTVDWSVISDDGDAVKGAVHFALSTSAGSTTTAAAPTTAPAPAAAATTAAASNAAAPTSSTGGGSTGMPVWAWVLIAVVVLAIIGVLVVRSRRSTGSS